VEGRRHALWSCMELVLSFYVGVRQ
jgi:hypothetical protein